MPKCDSSKKKFFHQKFEFCSERVKVKHAFSAVCLSSTKFVHNGATKLSMLQIFFAVANNSEQIKLKCIFFVLILIRK